MPPEAGGAVPDPHAERAVTVIVAGATRASGSANAAELLRGALAPAGFAGGSVQLVHAGTELAAVVSAGEAAHGRFVIVTGLASATLAAAYAMVKAIDARWPGARIELVVTGQDESRAHGAYARVRAAVARFLGRDLGFAGAFTDLDTTPAAQAGVPLPAPGRSLRATRAARAWAARLFSECNDAAWQDATHALN